MNQVLYILIVSDKHVDHIQLASSSLKFTSAILLNIIHKQSACQHLRGVTVDGVDGVGGHSLGTRTGGCGCSHAPSVGSVVDRHCFLEQSVVLDFEECQLLRRCTCSKRLNCQYNSSCIYMYRLIVYRSTIVMLGFSTRVSTTTELMLSRQ